MVTDPDTLTCRCTGSSRHARREHRALPASTPASCSGPNRRARLPAVVEAVAGTADNSADPGIDALPVQRHQRVPAQQLGLRQPDQQLPAGRPTSALLDRPDRPIEDRRPRRACRRTPRPPRPPRPRSATRPPPRSGPAYRTSVDALAGMLPTRLPPTYSLHRQGDLPLGFSMALTTSILPGRQAPSSFHTPITRPLPADPGQTHLSLPHPATSAAIPTRSPASRVAANRWYEAANRSPTLPGTVTAPPPESVLRPPPL